MSEQLWKARAGKKGKRGATDVRGSRGKRPAGDAEIQELASDFVWDNDAKPDNTDQKKLPAQMPRRAPPDRGRRSVEIDTPTTYLREVAEAPALGDTAFFDALPRRSPRRSWSAEFFWFAVCVLLPVAVATFYYARVASKQYVAEFRFTVKDASAQGAAASGTTGLMAILGSAAGGGNNNYVVIDYLTSRQILDAMDKRINLTSLYSKAEIDPWSRYNRSQPVESFQKYWRGHVTANFDQITGIAFAEVRAFSPQDALLIAETMIKLSEEMVNDVFNRPQYDAVRFAQTEVDKAEQRLNAVREKLTSYRVKSGVIDPTTSVAASAANLVQTLQATLAQQEAQLSTMLRQGLVPTAPTVVAIKHQIQSAKEQLAAVERSVGKSADGKPLSVVMSEYEQLDLQRQFSQTMVTGALQALDTARANAAAQHLYITPYVRPSLPTTSTYPNPFYSVVRVSALAFAFWLIALLIVRSIRERFT